MSKKTKKQEMIIEQEYNSRRQKLTCCKEMIDAVLQGKVDWFNEFYGEMYCIDKKPSVGFYTFRILNEHPYTIVDKKIVECPFCKVDLPA